MSKLILLIDDDVDEFHIFSIAIAMIEGDYQPVYAANVQQAMQLIAEKVPACIFVDANMPRQDGLSCVAHIRKLAHLDQVPVIVYSTRADEYLCKLAIAAGANDCVRKQDTLQRISDSLRQILQRV